MTQQERKTSKPSAKGRGMTIKKALAASAAGASLAVGMVGVSTINAPASHAIEWPGAGDVFSGGMAVYNFAARCKANLDNNIDCMQSTDKSIAEIHAMTKEINRKLDAYVVTYTRDQKYTSAALDNIIEHQSDDYVRAEMEKVEVDLENSHVALKLYNNFITCVTAATAPGEASPTCPKLNVFAVNEGVQPANVRAIINASNLFMDRQRVSPDGIGGYTPDPALFARRIGGTTTNPYKSWGLLNSILKREENIERSKQGLVAGQPLRYLSPEYVNHIGTVTNQITTLEENYFNVRELAAAMQGDDSLANAFASLAIRGRDDESPVLSIEQQRRAFSFPGWTPENPLKPNEAYFSGPRTGLVKLYTRGTTADAVETGETPTEQQVVNFATDMSEPGTNYSKLSALAPESLPLASGQQGRGNPTAAGRIWTKSQPLQMFTFKTSYSDSSKRKRYGAALSGTGDFGRHVAVWGRVGSGSPSRIDGMGSGSVPFQIVDSPTTATGAGSESHFENDDSFSYQGQPSAWAVPVTRDYTVRRFSGCDAVKMGPKIRNVCVDDSDNEVGGSYSVLASINGAPGTGAAAGLRPAANIDFIPMPASGVLQPAAEQG